MDITLEGGISGDVVSASELVERPGGTEALLAWEAGSDDAVEALAAQLAAEDD